MNRRCIAIALLLSSGMSVAHPLAPALLELREAESTPGGIRYAALWRTSISRVRGADVQPQLPEDCRAVGEARISTEENQSWVRRWDLLCAESLSGRAVRIAGLERSGINVILRFQPLQGAAASILLGADQSEATLPAVAATPPVFRGYFALGVEHLLFGFDHMLLVLGLVLLVRRVSTLLLTITAFTLGHSLTLALATLGVVRVNPALTEFGIAASILYLAVEILRPAQHASEMRRSPWLMAAAFGLLHGLGFAGALAEVGLPSGEIPLALFAFNLGIEAGQVLLVALLLIAGLLYRRVPVPVAARGFVALGPVYLIGSLAAFWCFERAALIMGA